MKKFFIYASVVGLVAGVIFGLCKKKKSKNIVSNQPVDKKDDFEPKPRESEISRNSNIMEEMYESKNESTKAIYERHSEAGAIMKEAYSNIMEDFVEDFSGEKNADEKGEPQNVIINNESVRVNKEIDLISDELDDLLK